MNKDSKILKRLVWKGVISHALSAIVIYVGIGLLVTHFIFGGFGETESFMQFFIPFIVFGFIMKLLDSRYSTKVGMFVMEYLEAEGKDIDSPEEFEKHIKKLLGIPYSKNTEDKKD